MDRRSFLKSIGAAGIFPALPIPSFAVSTTVAAPAVSAHTYQWAEMIVRAHNKCNLGLLQRSLQVNETVASALKSKLIENGIVTAQANAYGIHTATKPLYEGAFMNISETTEKVVETISDHVEDGLKKPLEAPENEYEINDLEEEDESDLEILTDTETHDEATLNTPADNQSQHELCSGDNSGSDKQTRHPYQK